MQMGHGEGAVVASSDAVQHPSTGLNEYVDLHMGGVLAKSLTIPSVLLYKGQGK